MIPQFSLERKPKENHPPFKRFATHTHTLTNLAFPTTTAAVAPATPTAIATATTTRRSLMRATPHTPLARRTRPQYSTTDSMSARPTPNVPQSTHYVPADSPKGSQRQMYILLICSTLYVAPSYGRLLFSRFLTSRSHFQDRCCFHIRKACFADRARRSSTWSWLEGAQGMYL